MNGDWRRLPSGLWVKAWDVPEGTPMPALIHHALRDFVDRVVAPLDALHQHCEEGRCLVREQHGKADQN